MSLTKSDGTIISEKVEHADTFLGKIVGLMFRKELQGVLIFDMGHNAFDGIHMLFVRFPIDVVFLDHDKNIINIKTNVRPWLGTAFPGAFFRYAIEMPAGTAEKVALKAGERLTW